MTTVAIQPYDEMLRTAVAQNLPLNIADQATVVKHAQCKQPLYSN